MHVCICGNGIRLPCCGADYGPESDGESGDVRGNAAGGELRRVLESLVCLCLNDECSTEW